MSMHNKMARLLMARCAKCDGDLEIRNNGQCYCTEKNCIFYAKPHPTGSMPNEGRQVK